MLELSRTCCRRLDKFTDCALCASWVPCCHNFACCPMSCPASALCGSLRLEQTQHVALYALTYSCSQVWASPGRLQEHLLTGTRSYTSA